MKRIICYDCEKREKELNELGYSISTSSSMNSSIEGQVLCEVCGNPLSSPHPKKEEENE